MPIYTAYRPTPKMLMNNFGSVRGSTFFFWSWTFLIAGAFVKREYPSLPANRNLMEMNTCGKNLMPAKYAAEKFMSEAT